jgi:DNA-binding SARP family transcriptional activator/tetratricopeptide (TPR) repeat protein
VLVRLLGPVDVAAGGGSRPVNGLRRKAVLAALALHEGQVVSAGRLVEVVWGALAPATVMNSLQTHVSYLRGVLGGKEAIVARPPGYLLNLGGDGTDARAAERLLRQGKQAADPAQGARDLREALALWRGRPLADVSGSAWLEEQAGRLDLLADQVRRALVEARLAAGQHADLVAELEQRAAADLLDEQVHGQLMVALYRCGRQAEALGVFARLRAALAGQLGIDPSPLLRELQTAILRQDQALAVPARPLTARPVPVPAQLPPAVPAFAGRAAELASLDAVLAQAQEDRPAGPAPVVISAVSGTAGVGKTALAVHWAHRVAPQFPGGQLYVNLRGFDPGGQPAEPGEAIRGFLDALGVAAGQIPDEVPAQAALYRSTLAGKRVLVVLDNARDPGQVRPLLPGSPGCLVIVTSRSDLAGLVAAEGACPVNLDLLPPAEAGDLLARRLGRARVAREPHAVAEIIERCARLPLALSIAAARAAARPGFPLAAIAGQLRGTTATLDPFGSNDRATDVRAVFSWSCQALSDDAAQLFRLLGLHPGPDVSVAAAASLAVVPPRRAEALLAELADAHLLSEHSPGRYTAHDLLRAYAAEQVHTLVPDDAQAAASHRILDHYLHTGHRAVALMDPHLDPLDLAPAQPGATAAELATADDALAWCTAEHPALLAAVHRAAAGDAGVPAWQLAWVLATYQLRCGLWAELEVACGVGLAAARRAGDAAGQAHCLYRIGTCYTRSGRIRQAGPVFEQALRQYESSGAHASQAAIHGQLFTLAVYQERPGDALRHALRAQELYRTSANRTGQAMALSDIGHAHAMLGNFSQALGYCEQALAGLRELDQDSAGGTVWDTLGYIHQQAGDHQQAIACYRRLVDLCSQTGDRFNEADALDTLGDVHLSAGDDHAARQAWAQALRILEEIDHTDTSRVRAKLSTHISPAPARAHPTPATAEYSLAHAPAGAASPDSEPSQA